MLTEAEIDNIAKQVATANLSTANVSGAISTPTTDPDGREALQITIVLTQTPTASIKGSKLLDTLVQIQDQLQQRGEERFPIVKFATRKELEEEKRDS